MKLYSTRNSQKKITKKFTKKLISKLGYEVTKKNTTRKKQNYDQDFIDLIQKKDYSEFTMLSTENLYSLFQSIKYVTENKIPGDIVECGVWRGGAMMFAIDTLSLFSDKNRNIWLFDTFAGMTPPTENDFDISGNDARETIKNKETTKNYVDWCYADLSDVKNNVLSTTYAKDKIHFIKGDVLQTIPKNIPDEISILRLDTDWYESTAHEVKNLYPRLTDKGILIVDDYGTWSGAKKAIDEYFKDEAPLLHRIDHTAVMMTKRSS